MVFLRKKEECEAAESCDPPPPPHTGPTPPYSRVHALAAAAEHDVRGLLGLLLLLE